MIGNLPLSRLLLLVKVNLLKVSVNVHFGRLAKMQLLNRSKMSFL